MSKTPYDVLLESGFSGGDVGVFFEELAAAGYVIVPKEPTAEMQWAGSIAAGVEPAPDIVEIYQAMLGACQ